MQEQPPREPFGSSSPGPARRDDLDTSHDAGASARAFTATQRAEVLALYLKAGERGLTHQELCDMLPQYEDSGTRTRSNELEKQYGKIVNTGMKRETRSGRKGYVWRALTPEEIAEAERRRLERLRDEEARKAPPESGQGELFG